MHQSPYCRAFENAEHIDKIDKDKHNLVKRLRLSPGYDPDLALVAEVKGEAVGHILFSYILVRGEVRELTGSLALAPVSVSVHPDFQGMGIGRALINEGHVVAEAKGYTSIIVLDHESYYPRFGYKPASTWGIKAPFDVPD